MVLVEMPVSIPLAGQVGDPMSPSPGMHGVSDQPPIREATAPMTGPPLLFDAKHQRFRQLYTDFENLSSSICNNIPIMKKIFLPHCVIMNEISQKLNPYLILPYLHLSLIHI